ncbi:MAG: LuxR C-terminal-related transcriptional regulator [Armatimonadota bacterium]|nr:LuxR C-terminal-related transcriptional regulator [Armatimonadota bacterium]MDR7451455.1 LuxR C-terminal-related transcriptional regulator [Armatimonadota bacterium]MDR7466395.1 LuxR C-terminal-related transcriptional regulator [Armatimonadota bacterium]MDR7493117.1 LuxR C-terminal-related transcriptional regulator [Armatimonadota bacterium]MDR7498126.1 LuxR C-terminal-related transcriptional regulator [Armatimonadota bacterium]
MASPLPRVDLAEFVAGAGEAAFAVDAAHTIVAWNSAAEDLLEVKAGEVLGRDCSVVIGGRNAEGHVVCSTLCPYRQAVRRNERPPTMDLQVRRNGRPPLWVRMISIVVTAGDPYVVHILHDITDDRSREVFVQQVLQAASSLSGRREAGTPPAPPALLSPREREILRLLATGAGTRAIAQALCISPATVRNHIQQIMTALHAHSRLEAVVKALRQRLI